jgi:hypothetical protein
MLLLRPRLALPLVVVLLLPAPVRAGLHYSGETFADLPSRWRGFLLDQRSLRQLAVRPAPGSPASALRTRYEQEAARLARVARERTPSADEAADLGALYLRLGEVGKALNVLRPAQRAHPSHYRLVSNLGTAWQLQGDLLQAAACLQQAVRLSPGRLQKAEELQLQVVRQRIREKPGSQELDDLFHVRYLGPGGKYEPGKLAPEQRRLLPSGAIAQAQQVALWLPADGRLLWQLAELANSHGDVRTAAAILDGCVIEFGLRHPDLLEHRRVLRTAVAERERASTTEKTEHDEEHALLFKPRSSRPLANKAGLAALPPIDRKGINSLPWELLADTTLDRKYRPTFAKYLQELDGLQVVLRGHLQPLGEGTDLEAFLLIENPVGCWYCEMPEMTGIVLVELPAGRTFRTTRDPIRVAGKLVLNATDPENYLFIIRDAKVTPGE